MAVVIARRDRLWNVTDDEIKVRDVVAQEAVWSALSPYGSALPDATARFEPVRLHFTNPLGHKSLRVFPLHQQKPSQFFFLVYVHHFPLDRGQPHREAIPSNERSAAGAEFYRPPTGSVSKGAASVADFVPIEALYAYTIVEKTCLDS